ncbi:MAG: hypothetical protein LH481_10815 [Burkholderiales bacterium]|nr:hypothetical protein [Burkholderiales bacterium]
MPTVEIAEGENRSSAGPINFSKLAAQVNLRYDAVGAQYCIANVTKDGYPHLYYYTWPSHNLGVAGYPPGNYSWSITCFSPQGTQTTVVANGYIKRPVSVAWRVSTTSTEYVLQVISNGGSVYWSVPNVASFDQANESTGADYCHILVYGFYGGPRGDANPFHPQYNVFEYYSQRDSSGAEILLWDSTDHFFPNYQHATFYFRYPQPHEGYKWLLRCWNTDGIEKTTVMYGKPQ